MSYLNFRLLGPYCLNRESAQTSVQPLKLSVVTLSSVLSKFVLVPGILPTFGRVWTPVKTFVLIQVLWIPPASAWDVRNFCPLPSSAQSRRWLDFVLQGGWHHSLWTASFILWVSQGGDHRTPECKCFFLHWISAFGGCIFSRYENVICIKQKK